MGTSDFQHQNLSILTLTSLALLIQATPLTAMESASGATKSAMKTCDICQNEFRSRGFASHHAKCKKEAETRGALQRLARLEQEKGYGEPCRH